ncbi:Origin of replication complex subunit 6 [Trifolium repens]|nr:Origin of replication complex subunit 6 [Trifolium repens]
MKDLCHDVFGVAKEKKDPKEVKTYRDLLDVLPNKRKAEDGGYLSDDGAEWMHDHKKEVPSKKPIQTRLNFVKEAPEIQKLEAIPPMSYKDACIAINGGNRNEVVSIAATDCSIESIDHVGGTTSLVYSLQT